MRTRVVHSHRSRSGFTLIELLVVIAIIGVLVGLLMPAVQATRESARATQCKNNLKQIALATESFQDSWRAYPPARYQPRPGDAPEFSCGGKETTWLIRIMPFLEQAAAGKRWSFSQTYASHPDDVRTFSLASYVCPSRRAASDAVGVGLLTATSSTTIRLPCGCTITIPSTSSTQIPGAVGDYGGNHGDLSPGSFGLPTDFYHGGNGTGVLISSRPQCESTTPMDWADRIRHKDLTDGLSTTILAGEMHVPLGKLKQSPEDAFIFNGDHVFNFSRVGGPTVPIVSDISSSGNGLVAWGSWHPSRCHFAMSDGSVRAITVALDTDILGRLCNRHDRLPVAEF